MEVLWDRHPLGAAEIIDTLAGSTRWKGNTVRTLLARLVQKGALHAEPEGKRYLYSPAHDRAAYVADESRSFLDRVFQGAPQPLLLHFVKSAKLSRDDIAEFRRILDGKEEK